MTYKAGRGPFHGSALSGDSGASVREVPGLCPGMDACGGQDVAGGASSEEREPPGKVLVLVIDNILFPAREHGNGAGAHDELVVYLDFLSFRIEVAALFISPGIHA